MNHGPLLFFATFVSLVASWFGLVLMPHLQFGRQESVKVEATGQLYPGNPPGTAAQGAQVYRANGCNYCHSQQVGITGVKFKLVLTESGTNIPAALQAVAKLNPDLARSLASALAATNAAPLAGTNASPLARVLPKTVLESVSADTIDLDQQSLTNAGAKAFRDFAYLGPDMDRNWGVRRSVAQDYLNDSPVMLGSTRLGPDLSNVGLRRPDANWHYLHLYAPLAVAEGYFSSMTRYPYLFEKRKIKDHPSPDALKLPAEYRKEIPPDTELVPTEQARELVAYLLSRRMNAYLFEAPLPGPPPTNAPAPGTNAPGTNASGTNLTGTNAPAASNTTPTSNPPSAK